MATDASPHAPQTPGKTRRSGPGPKVGPRLARVTAVRLGSRGEFEQRGTSDRWRWIVTSIVPRFRRFDVDTRLADTSLHRIFDEARDYASKPLRPSATTADKTVRTKR